MHNRCWRRCRPSDYNLGSEIGAGDREELHRFNVQRSPSRIPQRSQLKNDCSRNSWKRKRTKEISLPRKFICFVSLCRYFLLIFKYFFFLKEKSKTTVDCQKQSWRKNKRERKRERRKSYNYFVFRWIYLPKKKLLTVNLKNQHKIELFDLQNIKQRKKLREIGKESRWSGQK